MYIGKLRAEAHRLIDICLPVDRSAEGKKKKQQKTARYLWLKEHFEKVHMSECSRHELLQIIICLQSKRLGDHCIIHSETHSHKVTKPLWVRLKRKLIYKYYYYRRIFLNYVKR